MLEICGYASYGEVAQLGEHHVRNVGVEGSNPFFSTTKTGGGATGPERSAAPPAGKG